MTFLPQDSRSFIKRNNLKGLMEANIGHMQLIVLIIAKLWMISLTMGISAKAKKGVGVASKH
jgi:hypothetical protein